MRHKVIYFRGLSTYHDDGFHMGPWSVAPAYEPLAKQFRKIDVDFVPVLGMKSGRVLTKVQRAIEFLSQQDFWKKGEPFHIFGHSTGGIVARAFVHHIENPERVLSLTTVGTPHHGSELAERAFTFPESHPLTYKLFKTFGYDSQSKLEFYLDLRPGSLIEFNKRFPNINEITYAHVPISLPYNQLCWPIRFIHQLWAAEVYGEARLAPPSDGMILLESQKWGERLRHFDLDHDTQIGFIFYVNPYYRRVYSYRFGRLCLYLKRWWKLVEERKKSK